MSGCTCKTEIEAKLAERFKANTPDAKDHQVSLGGYGFAIVGNKMELRPTTDYRATATFTSKGGITKQKTSKGTMAFSFCPYCGTKIGGAA